MRMDLFTIAFFCLGAALSLHTDRTHHFRQSESQEAVLQADVDAQLDEYAQLGVDAQMQADLKFLDSSHISLLVNYLFVVGLPLMNKVIKREIEAPQFGCVYPNGKAKNWMIADYALCPTGFEKVHYRLDPMDLTATAKPRIVPIHRHEQCLDVRNMFGAKFNASTCNGITVVAEGGCDHLSGISDFKLEEVSITGTGTFLASNMEFAVELEAKFPQLKLGGCAFSVKDKENQIGFAIKANDAIRIGKFEAKVIVKIHKIDLVNILRKFVPLFCAGKGVTKMFLSSFQAELLDFDFTIPEVLTPTWVNDESKGVIQLVTDAGEVFSEISKVVSKVLTEHIEPAEERMQYLFKREVNDYMKDNFKALRMNKWALGKIDQLLGDIAAVHFKTLQVFTCGFNAVVQYIGKVVKKAIHHIKKAWNSFIHFFFGFKEVGLRIAPPSHVL